VFCSLEEVFSGGLGLGVGLCGVFSWVGLFLSAI
jgi:hypothetical protein